MPVVIDMDKKETIGDRIHRRRLALGVSLNDLARALGKNRSTIYRYENSRIEKLPSGVLEALSQALDTTPEALMGWNAPPPEAVPARRMRPLPIIGSVRAGWNGPALEEREGVDYADVGSPSEYFYLRVQGDSMAPHINAGDLALVHCQPTADSGDIVVVIVEDEMGTIKQYLRRGGSVVLHPFNERYGDRVFSGEALNQLRVVGRVVETKRKW